jgi:hypothetical protein
MSELNAHRGTLTLELAILSEHKIAKSFSFWKNCAGIVRTSKIGWIRRRSKWLSLPTLDQFLRLFARTINVTLPVRAEAASGTNPD